MNTAGCSVISALAMTNRRHLAHRIDRQIVRLTLLAGLEAQHVQVVVDTQLLEQREGAGGAGLRRVEEGDVLVHRRLLVQMVA